jgi:DNA polymerase-4
MDRRIAHLDMDAFYASVELLRYPQLRGLPVVVGGRGQAPPPPDTAPPDFPRLKTYAGRGVATTASYEARALGVHSGMGLMKAAQLAPGAILLPADFEAYRRYSRRFKAAVAELAPKIEDRGIDEIYIDLTEVPGDAATLAAEIKRRVFRATGLKCSIGITPNKLLSKIASELDKPDGLTLLSFADLPTRIWPLAVKKINGIGPKASAKLNTLGIHTVGELAAASPQLLLEHFGKHYGRWMLDAAHGRDERTVETSSEPKSISRETTFDRDLDPRRDRAELSRILISLCEGVARDLKRKGYLGKAIGIKLRFEDFRTLTRVVTQTDATDDAAAILAAARACLKRVTLERRLRLLGVRAATLVRPGEQVPSAREPAPENLLGETLPLFG